MVARFTDSFDHYVTADMGQKWTDPASATISSGNGRRSTASMRLTSWNSGPSVTLDSQATWVVGFALKFSALPSSTGAALVDLFDVGTSQVTLWLEIDGTLSVYRGSTFLGGSAGALSVGVTYYVEFKATINDTTGAAEVRVNGATVITLTSIDTQRTANATASQVSIVFSGDATSANVDIDDLVVCDGTGSANNTFLGDRRVDAYLPSDNGNSSQLVGSDGNSTDNYLLVDETTANGDTDYVESSTVGNKDTYAVTDMTHTPSGISFVQINMVAKKDDAGARSIAAVTRSGGSDTDGATQALGTSYAVYREIRSTDPNTSAAWTKTNLNNAEFGAKCAA